MFPVTDSSQTIIDCFIKLTEKYGIKVQTQCEVFSITRGENMFHLKTSNGEYNADFIICALGGHPKAETYRVIKNIGHTIDNPIPSLFTFNLPADNIKNELQGISVPNAMVQITGSKFNYAGPVLITHWGLSGPAVLKLSAFAAHEFHEKNYNAGIRVNWIYPQNFLSAETELKRVQSERGKSLPANLPCFDLPKRLWEYLCTKSGLNKDKRWAEVNKKEISLLARNLVEDSFVMQGKTTFKEEFVTAGGINLKEVNFKTMESKIVPGLYFCGEVLNIDGITGGFNFQSAWSTAWICAQSIN
jgi:predicted Rossmann fold flavoprotein